ncbi:MAG: glutamate-5-semialdehyde dehydrogenase [Deltaproteobacteria bacterium]|nr:glutamate-5-semialdehyde dehydrogenase [Deltaproteobacteria bacterium]
MSTDVHALLGRARGAARRLARLSAEARAAALEAVALAIEARAAEILAANAEDVAAAEGLSGALVDRLRLDAGRVAAMVRAVREVKGQPDPLAARREVGVGRSGIRVTRRRVPLGVVAIVYEARPNVTAECAALTLKSGNAVVLRGGKEARRSNAAIGAAVQAGLRSAGVPEDAVVLMADSTREDVAALLGAVGMVDLVIPRGGHGLMRMVDELAKVPVIRHGQGICHVYVDAAADPKMAAEIAFNAKVQRPGVCNAMETLLVHRSRLQDVLPVLGPRLVEAGVELRADEAARTTLAAAGVEAAAATLEDWDTEFLDLVLAVRTVDDLDAALDHIDAHGTHHTASIVTADEGTAERFLGAVDASCVLWNASTRFNDGGELGLGAEMGISTSKMHAYGPMGALELTAEKLVVYGQGQTRA